MPRSPGIVVTRRGRIVGTILTVATLLAAGLFAANLAKNTRPIGRLSGATGTPKPTSASLSQAKTSPGQGHRAHLDVYAHVENDHIKPSLSRITPRVYVPNMASGTVDEIDPRTFEVVRRFRVGSYPQHITPSWDLKHLFVNDTAANSLTVIDPRSGRSLKKISVRDPYNLYFTPDGSKAIVVAESFSSLDFRNPRSWRLIRSVHIPSTGPNHLDFSADGRYLLLSTEFGGHIVKVNVKKMKVTGDLNVGGSPVDVRVAPDGSVFYNANQDLGGVSVIDPRTMRQIRFIRTGRGAHGLCVSRDGATLYVANRLAGTISLIDFKTRKEIATWNVGGSPDMMQVTPDGSMLWVSNRYNRTVSVVNTQTGHVLHRIGVGRSPHGIDLFPQPGRHSLGHNGMYR